MILKIIPLSNNFNRKPIIGSRPSMAILSLKGQFSLHLNRWASFSSLEVALLLVSTENRDLWLTSGLLARSNTGILVPRAHDPSGLWQGSRALAGPDFLSMRSAFVSYSRPIRFDGKSVNRGLPVLDQARALDPCHRPEGSWALGTRMASNPKWKCTSWQYFYISVF